MHSGEEKGGELDIRSFVAIILNNLPIVFFLVLASLFFSAITIRNATPIYVSEAVIASPSESNSEIKTSGFENFESVGASLGIFPRNLSSNSLLPRMLGREFLSIVIEKEDLTEHLQGNDGCGDKNPQFFSVTGFLVALNLYEFKVANETQIKDSFADCLKEMISIKNFTSNKIKTSAFTIQVRDRDSLMAQKIANALIDEYFLQELSQKKQSYENTLAYFSDILAKTKIDVEKEKLKMDRFLLSNFEFIAPSLSKTGNFSTDPREMLNGFTGKLILEINDFKRRGEKLVDTVNILNTIFEIDDYNLNNLTNAQKKDLYVNVSRELAENIEKTVNNTMITDTQKLNLKNAIKVEIERLRLLSLDVENVILKKNNELKKVLENSKAFSEIELNFLRKSNYYKQLQLSIDKNYIEAGILETSEPVIYARATQSMIPTEPNIKSIFISNVIIATVIGLLLILVKYIFVPKIYHVRQLDSLSINGTHILLSNRKELKAEKLSSGENNYLNLNFDFLNKIKEKGSIGCIIDIENKNDSMTFYSDKISLYLANFFANSNQKSLCCVKEPGFSRISLPSNIARFYNLSNDKEIEANNKKIALASFQSNTAKADLDSLANIFKRFDNVFISAGEDCSIAFKFNLIDRCDFFILVGKIGGAKLDKFESFLGQSKIISEKYVGCIMVKK